VPDLFTPEDHDPFSALGGVKARTLEQVHEDQDAARARKAQGGIDPQKSVNPDSCRRRKHNVDMLALSMRRWEKLGYKCARAETVGYGGMKHDQFGFIDHIAFRVATKFDGVILVGVQSTSWGNVPARLQKMAGKPQGPRPEDQKEADKVYAHVLDCLAHGMRIWVDGFHQPDGHGTEWKCAGTAVTREMIEDLHRQVLEGKRMAPRSDKPKGKR
jgi:hypothetical protein